MRFFMTFLYCFGLVSFLLVPASPKRSEAFVITGALTTAYAMSNTLAVASAAFATAGAYICWQNSNSEFFQSLDAQEEDGTELTRSEMREAVKNAKGHTEPGAEVLDSDVVPGESDYKTDNYYFKFKGSDWSSAPACEGWSSGACYGDDFSALMENIDFTEEYYSLPKTYYYATEPCNDFCDHREYKVKKIENADTTDETLEDKYPDTYGDDNIVDSYLDIYDKSNLDLLWESESGTPSDAYDTMPDGRSNTAPVSVAGVNTGDSNSSAGYILTPEGEKITVPKGSADDVKDNLNAPEIDESSVGDSVIDDADENTGPVPISDDLDARLDDAGVYGDINGISGNTIKWVDDAGDTHITTVNQDLVSDVANVVPDDIVSNWESAGSSDVTSAKEEITIDAEGDVPELSHWSGSFDPSVSVPDKKDIPVDSWKDSIPFLGALQDTQVTYANSNPSMTIDFTVGTKSFNKIVDFSQWSDILGNMGQVLVAVASFFALRFALIS